MDRAADGYNSDDGVDTIWSKYIKCMARTDGTAGTWGDEITLVRPCFWLSDQGALPRTENYFSMSRESW
jgi:hypothetical protein